MFNQIQLMIDLIYGSSRCTFLFHMRENYNYPLELHY